MKKGLLKKFYASLIMVLFAAISLGTSTYAWFSMNNTVTVSGMEVTAVADGNLVINKNAKVPMLSTDISTSFAGDAYELRPMTWASSWEAPKANSEIDQQTGFIISGELEAIADEAFVKATPKSTEAYVRGFYIDYLIYIASAGEKLENKDIYVNLSELNLDEFYKGALSIAFYLGEEDVVAAQAEATNATQAGVAPVVVQYGKDFTENDVYVEDTKIKIGSFAEIPSCAAQADGVPILMRLYFDGELTSTVEDVYYGVVDTPVEEDLASYYVLKDETKTGDDRYAVATEFNTSLTYYTKTTKTVKYINSSKIPVNNCVLAITFTAEEAE